MTKQIWASDETDEDDDDDDTLRGASTTLKVVRLKPAAGAVKPIAVDNSN